MPCQAFLDKLNKKGADSSELDLDDDLAAEEVLINDDYEDDSEPNMSQGNAVAAAAKDMSDLLERTEEILTPLK